MESENSHLEYIGMINVKNLEALTRKGRFSGIRYILLNQIDMDKLAMEIRSSYRERFFEPFKLNGIPVKEDYPGSTPPGRVRVVLWKKRSF